MKPTIKISLIIIFLLILILFFIRALSPKEIDDIHPLRECEREYIEKADVLWVMPFYENFPISENKSWCEEILSLNKTIGMHGIKHTYNEFLKNISNQEIQNAIQEFEKCFGYKSETFKPPHLKITKENKKLIKENNLKLKYRANQLIHKVYHCQDSGTLDNWIIDLF